MRIPYNVGRWVRGRNHYGRARLIDYLLHAPDSAIWLVGTRRVGKTSLLRQLELLTSEPECEFEPLFWDLQGCQSPRDLSDELFFTLEDVAERFAARGIDVATFAGKDALVILRTLTRLLHDQHRKLLILVDEAEVLIDVARADPPWVARLRRALQDNRLRTIMTSTQLLAQLNPLSSQWATSPFLFGFTLASLGKLEDADARALIRQTQTEQPVTVADGTADDILIHTNGQPYLIQYLCQRLFEPDGPCGGRLRPLAESDLVIDYILAGLFQIDFQHLTRSERRLLLAVADLTIAKEGELLTALSDLPPHRIRKFLYGLERLGYVRQVFGQWAVGNEFLRRWVVDNYDALRLQLDAAIDDGLHETLLEVGHSAEVRFLRDEIARVEAAVTALEAALSAAPGEEVDRLLTQIEQLRGELARLRRQLASITRDFSGS
jgi:hypothetical protein